ncbi:hypothetical protein HDV05_004379 [Chytridiales sp. JEL 0842]|nr:hypothetical protein HDV05_004379 [Chytridiales sp. JEL 0842]
MPHPSTNHHPRWLTLLAATTTLVTHSLASSTPDTSIHSNRFCSPTGTIEDACCEFKTVDSVNEELAPFIDELVTTSFFRYFKVDLDKGCPFWKENPMCVQRDCSVQLTDDSEIPSEWKAAALSSVDYSTAEFGFGALQKKCEFSDKDFCVVEDESSSEGSYVNLLKNPERFTGYAGDSAARIWRAIYEENCFKIDDTEPTNELTSGSSGGTCTEKRVFYKLVSGLHASISTHICDKYLNRKTGDWYRDVDCFVARFGKFNDRIENLYFTYVVLLRALTKLAPYLQSYSWCTGDIDDRAKIESLVSNIVSTTMSCPPTFNEKLLFADSASHGLKEEFKSHFRNISRIMDCVGCDKCRLWGKLQITGLGTALKILFSYENPKAIRLTRSELVALVNGFGRLSDSLRSVRRFRQVLEDRDHHIKTPLIVEHDKFPPVNVDPNEPDPVNDSKPKLDLQFTMINDPKRLITVSVGLVILVVGFISVCYKGYQMEKGTMKVPEEYEKYTARDAAKKESEKEDKKENEGVDVNIRADARSRADSRPFTFETGLITQASGSCRIKVQGGTDVLVGIKVEIGSIEGEEDGQGPETGGDEEEGGEVRDVKRRDRGRVVCNVECASSAMRNFDNREVEDMTLEYSEMMNRVLNGDHGGLNLQSLCIIPGSTCWVIYVDALILDYGGNLLDTIFMATRGALQNTLIPKVTVEESGGHYEFDVEDEETEVLEGWEDVPVLTTLYKIGARHIIDPSPLEELCASARLSVAVNRKGNVCAIQKGGKGGIEPSLLSEMIKTGKQIGLGVLSKMETALDREKARIGRREDPVGFR